MKSNVLIYIVAFLILMIAVTGVIICPEDDLHSGFPTGNSVAAEKPDSSFLEPKPERGSYRSEHGIPEIEYVTGSNRTIRDGASSPEGKLHGIVLTMDGEPVPRARVSLREPGEQGEPWVSTDDEGCYSLPVKEPGVRMLSAVKIGKGIAPSILVEPDPAREMEAPPLIIKEFGTVRGRVVNPLGRPLREVLVELLPIRYIDVEGIKVAFASNVFERLFTEETERNGIAYGMTTTDECGRFRISGLREGKYFCYSRSLMWPYFWTDEEPFERVTCETGDDHVEIVWEAYVIEFTLKEGRGKLITDAELLYEFEIPVKEGLFLDGIRQEDFRKHRGHTYQLDGTFMGFVQPGPVHVKAATENGLYAEEELHIPEGQYLTESTLVLKKRQEPPGRIALRITGPEGEQVPSTEDLYITLHGSLWKLSSFEFTESDLEKNAAGELLMHLPADTYLIRVTPKGPDRYYFDQSTSRVAVASGQTTPLHITLPKGGRMKLTMKLSRAHGPPRGLKLILERDDPERGFETEGGFRRLLEKGKKNSIDLKELEAGVEYEYDTLLKPGRCRLRIAENGIHPYFINFTITPGQVTPVEVTL